MNSQTDPQLLQDYAGNHSEPAFAELVRRHIDLVYSAALRMVCDPHQAEDVTQGVFVALAQNAPRLVHHPVLSGWLHRTTQNLAANAVRANVRRQAREQEAATMNELLSAGSDLSRLSGTEAEATWEHIAPHLDAALGELGDADRDAVLLRYFERKSAREMALTLGTTEDAAQKRVSRAVERLRELFAKRGVTAGAGGLVVIISAHAVQAAPAGLALTIATAATVAGTSATAAATVMTAKIIALTTLQKVLVTAAVTVLAGAGIFETCQASRLRGQVETLSQQQATIAGQIAALNSENERLSNQIASLQEAGELAELQRRDLSRLRHLPAGQYDAGEIARLKALLVEQNGKLPDYFTNVLVAAMPSMLKWQKKQEMARLARMNEKLRFTPDQELAISNLLVLRVERQIQRQIDSAMRGAAAELTEPAPADGDPDAEIKALLSPEQLAAYPEYRLQEETLKVRESAQFEVERLALEVSLTNDQQEKLKQKLTELKLSNLKSDELTWQAVNEASRNSRHDEAIQLSINSQTRHLDEKLSALGDILTPEQIKAYREEEMKIIDLNKAVMKQHLRLQPTAK